MAEESLVQTLQRRKRNSLHPVCGYRKDKSRDKLFHGIQGWSHPWLAQSRGLEAAIFVVLCKEAGQLTMESVMAHA